MAFIAYTVLFIYSLALLLIIIHCAMQFQLLYVYKKNSKSTLSATKSVAGQIVNFPMVTIQLPIFNELYVTERLIDNIMMIDYPKDRFEVQVLDDSTDETRDISIAKVNEYKNKGFHIEHIHRIDRSGYKAGALREATKKAKGEFIAIFDADFLPRTDFLLRTIPHFEDGQIGVVQTRWEHINEDYSILTRLQALHLNVHFLVEQPGRELGKYFLQFNGTAGVWRKKTIDDAGGWEADTLTEDLDLSYRAQLRGWRIHYLPEVGSPAELPAEMNGIKSQQFRWMKGGAESARKLLPTVWQSSSLSLNQKLQATDHLMGSSIFLFIFVAAVFSVPLLFLMKEIDIDPTLYSVFLAGLLSVFIVYYTANERIVKQQSTVRKLIKLLFIFPIFLALSMGLSLHNSIAVIQGYMGKQSAFIRTPKYGIRKLTDSFINRKYRRHKMSWTTIMEALMSIYFISALVAAVYYQSFTFFFFHLLLAVGFGIISFFSLKHARM